MSKAKDTPFPLDGGRAGDGGGAAGGVRRARRLRRTSTLAERLLWAELRKVGLNFRRQAPMGRYIVDFVSHACRLVIEIDGYFHEALERQAQDAARTAWLNGEGYRVVRFNEKTVRDDLYLVVERIVAEAAPPPSPPLPPSRGKGEPRYRP